MKKLIRKGVFECNSSSSHSISIAGEDKQFILDTIYPNQNGVIYVNGGEFGWEWMKYNDAETKLSYAYQDNVDEDLLRKVVMDQTGATSVIFHGKDNGYIDHESVGTVRNEVGNDEQILRNFIFNKNSWLFTGNDNGTPDPTFYHVPEYRDNKMIVPEYKFELSIEGLTKKTKFLKKPDKTEIRDAVTSLTDGILMSDSGYVNDDHSIFFQISRPRGMWFEKNYMVKQDYSKGYLILTLENSLYTLESELKSNGIITNDMDWPTKQDTFNKELLKRKDLYKKLKITISKIDENNR